MTPQALHRGTALLVLAIALVSCGRTATPLDPQGAFDRPAAAATPATPLLGGGWVPRQAIVVLSSKAVVGSFLQDYDLKQVEATTIDGVEYRLVQAQGPVRAEDLVALLEKDGDVEWVSLNRMLAAPEYEGQPMSFDDGGGRNKPDGYSNQDLLFRIRAPEAHRVTRGAGSRVAILDTGIDYEHPGWGATTLVRGLNFSVVPRSGRSDEIADGRDGDGDGFVDEAYGHGTHVAGIVHLVAPEATLIAIKVLDDEGWGTCFGLAAGIMNAMQLGAGIINLSVGLTAADPIVGHAVAFASGKGVAVVASAGNKASEILQYPAGYPEALSVTAVDDRDVLAPFANRGAKVAIAAPGVDIISLMARGTPLGLYAAGDGTSMAAPFVSGATALILSAQPGLGGGNAAGLVVAAATPISQPGLVGRGRVDLAAALPSAPPLYPVP